MIDGEGEQVTERTGEEDTVVSNTDEGNDSAIRRPKIRAHNKVEKVIVFRL